MFLYPAGPGNRNQIKQFQINILRGIKRPLNQLCTDWYYSQALQLTPNHSEQSKLPPLQILIKANKWREKSAIETTLHIDTRQRNECLRVYTSVGMVSFLYHSVHIMKTSQFWIPIGYGYLTVFVFFLLPCRSIYQATPYRTFTPRQDRLNLNMA